MELKHNCVKSCNFYHQMINSKKLTGMSLTNYVTGPNKILEMPLTGQHIYDKKMLHTLLLQIL